VDHRIEKFMAVVECESFTDAAERLRVSQPSLSVAIKNLEKELGVALINRGGNFFQVTEEGKLVYEYGSQARLQLNNLKSELSKEAMSAETLRVGMIDSVADALFSEGNVNTEAKLEVRIDNSSRLLQSLRLDRTDMAIITKPFGGVPSEYRVIGECEEKFQMVCAVSKKNSVATELKKDCRINDFLTYDQTSTTYQWINKAMATQGVTFTPKFFSTNPELMLQMALVGRGTALLPTQMVAEGLKKKQLAVVPGFKFARAVVTVTLKDKFISDDMIDLTRGVESCLKR
jgi:DNA-binding transcriptional LysR family regulator